MAWENLHQKAILNIYSKMGINTSSLRLFNVYGPGQNMKNLRQGMVSIYMAYILKNEEVLVKGSGERFRDFIYIDDVIDLFIICIDNPRSYGNVYNVGTGVKTTVNDLIKLMLELFGYVPHEYPVKFSGSTPGDIFGIYADITRIKEDLGWMPRVTLKEGLKK